MAPSPTGSLHLGNARTFLVNWLYARQRGWRIQLRVEDIDGPRIKRGADRELVEDLRWLGIDWDEQSPHQSSRLGAYKQAERRLAEKGLVYPCVCSRKEVELAASAPHAEDGAAVYPGTCRERFDSPEAAHRSTGRAAALRFRAPAEIVDFVDGFAGPQRFDVQRQLGDFVIAKADGTPAYQLAVVVDDAAMRVTDVVRGDDLLDSTPRQILLYRALGLGESIPNYYHLPLVVGTDGRRLAKRHGDTRLAYYRSRGVSPRRVLALLAEWCGAAGRDAGLGLAELLQSFDPGNMSRQPIVFLPGDDAWLLAGRS